MKSHQVKLLINENLPVSGRDGGCDDDGDDGDATCRVRRFRRGYSTGGVGNPVVLVEEGRVGVGCLCPSQQPVPCRPSQQTGPSGVPSCQHEVNRAVRWPKQTSHSCFLYVCPAQPHSPHSHLPVLFSISTVLLP